MSDVDSLVDEYWAWLRARTTLREIGAWTEITTPYLDRHNDSLQIYAQRDGDRFVLTDDGFTISDLEMSGCSLDSPKRQELLRTALNGFGVRHVDGALEVRAGITDFARKKHDLIQAMLATNDLFYLASPTIASLFYEDVVGWLDDADVRYTPEVKFTGTSGYDHRFDFVIPRSRIEPERVLRVINRPDRQAAQTVAFAWHDARDVRPPESRAYAILNDNDRRVSGNVLEALNAYEVTAVPWAGRQEFERELAA